MQKTQRRQRLRVLRAEANLTQYETARRARIGMNRYWKIEAGWTEPTEQDRARIAKVFNVSEADAFPDAAGSHNSEGRA